MFKYPHYTYIYRHLRTHILERRSQSLYYVNVHKHGAQLISKYHLATLHICEATPAIEPWSAIELLPRIAQREAFLDVSSIQKVTAGKYISVRWSRGIDFNNPESRHRVKGACFWKEGCFKGLQETQKYVQHSNKCFHLDVYCHFKDRNMQKLLIILLLSRHKELYRSSECVANICSSS
jgi:hypothetical protein